MIPRWGDMVLGFEKFVEISGLLDKGELQKVELFAYFGFLSRQEVEFGSKDIVQWFNDANLHSPNVSRLMKNISGSTIFAKGSKKGYYKLHATELRVLDDQFGEYFEAQPVPNLKSNSSHYVNKKRIKELATIKSEKYDFKKLISLCNELNMAHGNGAVYSCAMLLRAILDHVPPIFGCQNFTEVANNYGSGRSFKKSVKYLDNSSRNIADQYLHAQIRVKEATPTPTQVDYSNDLDVLLSEIVRVLE